MTEEAQSGTRPIVIGGLVVMLFGGLYFLMTPRADPVSPPAQVVAAPEPAVQPEAAVTTETDIAEATPEPPAAPEPLVPEFDTFRVETDGSMVIAGRAEPGQTVDIILAGQAIDRVQADNGGNFVSLPVAVPSEQPRRLSLMADPEGAAIASTTSYIVAPIAAPIVVASVPTPPPEAPESPQLVEDDVAAAAADAPIAQVPLAPAAPTVDTPVAPPAAPTVLQADADGVRVVQGAPTVTPPQINDNVALDAITYDPQGEVQLSGRATGDGAVQVYIDNQPLTTSEVTQGGDWRIDLPDIDTGVYTLRIDEVDEDGVVVSRLETPFKREEPEDVAAVLAEETSVDGFEVAVRTVQPGATLWAIAEENLGSGIFYVEVFEANSDLIRDPDLIYPGQIFRIPEISQ